jgi:hypothetical protein
MHRVTLWLGSWLYTYTAGTITLVLGHPAVWPRTTLSASTDIASTSRTARVIVEPPAQLVRLVTATGRVPHRLVYLLNR